MAYSYELIEKRDDFLFVVSQLDFKDLDNAEAIELGYASVKQMFNTCFYYYSKYYFVRGNKNEILCAIELRRDGNLTYFVTKDLTANKIPSLVRTVKTLADETVSRVDVIFTTTLNSYEGAIAFNKMVGFIMGVDKGKFSIWAYEKK